MNLRYWDWGNAEAPLILLVHGTRDHARGWDWTAAALAQDWHVVAPDLRGHGDSQWSPDGAYLGSAHVLDMVNLLDALKCETLSAVAHSLGGHIMTHFAGAYPQRMQKLALIEGLGPSPAALSNWARIGDVQRLRNWLAKHRTKPKPAIFQTIAEAAARLRKANPYLAPDQALHLATHGVRPCGNGLSWKYDPLANAFAPEDFSDDQPAFWREITCPVLLFHGADSWNENAESDGRAQHFRNWHSIVVEKAGHSLHHDRFDVFIAALRAFL